MKKMLILLLFININLTAICQTIPDSVINRFFNNEKIKKENDEYYIYDIAINSTDFSNKIWEKVQRSDSLSYYLRLKDSINLISKNSEFKEKDYLAAKDYINVYALAEKYGLMFIEHNVIGNEYSIGLNFKIMNISKKTIKYIYLNTQAYNPVDDPLGGNKLVRAIGPILGYQMANYEFENVVFSKIATRLNITSIKIQYMDGSIKLIPKNIIYKLMLGDDAAKNLLDHLDKNNE